MADAFVRKLAPYMRTRDKAFQEAVQSVDDDPTLRQELKRIAGDAVSGMRSMDQKFEFVAAWMKGTRYLAIEDIPGAKETDETRATFSSFARECQESMYKRINESAANELIGLMTKDGEATEDAREALTRRLKEWDEAYIRRELKSEAVRMSGATIRYTYDELGYESIWYATTGECELCRRLNGHRVRVGENFEGGGRGIFTHPPMHKGCNCTIVPGKKIAAGTVAPAVVPASESAAGEKIVAGANTGLQKGGEGGKINHENQETALKNAAKNAILSVEKEVLQNRATMDNKTAREWYIGHDKTIPSLIDRTQSTEGQARQAFELRNFFRTSTRELMADQELRKELDARDPNRTFEELVEHKSKKYGMSREDAMSDIIRSATATRESVNRELGVEG